MSNNHEDIYKRLRALEEFAETYGLRDGIRRILKDPKKEELIEEKPEPEVIIRKSGGTWVARYDGIDYLCVDPKRNNGIASDIWESVLPKQLKDTHWWKPFSEIEITDNIALFRPMVIWNHPSIMRDILNTLYGVSDDEFGVIGRNYENKAIDTYSKNHIRLATVSDLEPS